VEQFHYTSASSLAGYTPDIQGVRDDFTDIPLGTIHHGISEPQNPPLDMVAYFIPSFVNGKDARWKPDESKKETWCAHADPQV